MGKEFYRSIGIELSGAKSNRSSLAVLDYYAKKQRLILLDVEAKLSSPAEASPDELLIEAITYFRKEAQGFAGISIHGPLSFPPYLQQTNTKKLPFPEKSKDPEVQWMNEVWKNLNPQPRPFVPYLQRPAEIWLRYFTNEKFLITDGFGSNGAPLAARLHFLKPYFPKPVFEVFPRATMSRLVSSLNLPKWMAADYTDLERGVKAREEFLAALLKRIPQLFMYNKDHETMILHLSSFNAFLAGFTQFLIFKEQCENPPRLFPRDSDWIFIPRTSIAWEKVFKG